MFKTTIKNYQTRYLSRTWQESLQKKATIKNNYLVTGDIKKAKNFVNTVSHFTFQPSSENSNEQIIFSKDMVVDYSFN